MASFKTHVSLGAALGIVGAIAFASSSVMPTKEILVLVICASTLASMLPDVDSDSGLPFQLVFGAWAFTCAGIGMLYVWHQHITDWRFITGIPLGLFFIVRGIFAPIAKRFTHHRGMFHSIPALFIAVSMAALALEHFVLRPEEKIAILAAVSAGFLSHLVLDEIVSVTNFSGIPFVPKKSLGSALKLYSSSRTVTVATYVILVALLYITLPIFLKIGYN